MRMSFFSFEYTTLLLKYLQKVYFFTDSTELESFTVEMKKRKEENIDLIINKWKEEASHIEIFFFMSQKHYCFLQHTYPVCGIRITLHSMGKFTHIVLIGRVPKMGIISSSFSIPLSCSLITA